MSWQDKLRKVKPYIAGEQPKETNIIKLNTNENPYEPTPKIKEVLKSLDVNKLKLYPDDNSLQLKEALAKYYGLNKEQIFVGNGSDEVLALTFLTFFNGTEPILFPDITYSFYPVYCNLYQMSYKQLLVDEEFKIKKEDYYQPNSGIIIPNPNAPTGLLVNLDFIEDILINNPNSMVVIDEAYIDFGGVSAISLLDKYDNLLIIQTYSKSRSLAGIRIGVALGSKEAITHLNNVKNSFNSYPIDYIAQQVALTSVLDSNHFKENAKKIIITREHCKKELSKLGFIVLDSYANFVFVRHPNIDAKELFLTLKENQIIVRHFNVPRINQYLRITIGTDEQMKVLLDFLNTYCNK